MKRYKNIYFSQKIIDTKFLDQTKYFKQEENREWGIHRVYILFCFASLDVRMYYLLNDKTTFKCNNV